MSDPTLVLEEWFRGGVGEERELKHVEASCSSKLHKSIEQRLLLKQGTS